MTAWDATAHLQAGGPCPLEVGEAMFHDPSDSIIASPTSRGGGPPIAREPTP